MVYGSEESVQATDDLFEQFAYNTLKSSVDLAEER
jgi:ribonucleotide reductase alpha subunit